MSEISVAFLGSHPLGERCLELLADHESVSVKLVVTYRPDEPRWWEGNLFESASEKGHNVVPISDEDELLSLNIDYLVSVYYPNILGEEILSHPSEAALNLHQAELPRYRGSNVFTHSILNARSDDYWKHGTTLHVMTEEVDAGDIIDRRFVDIEETDTAWSLYQKTETESVALFKSHIPDMVNRRIDELRTPQSKFEGPRYFHQKSSVYELKDLPRSMVAEGGTSLYDRIRALDFPPHEPAFTKIQGEKIYLTLSGYQES